MKRFRLLTATLAGIAIYVGLSISVGRNGLWAYSQMEEQRRSLSINTAAIERTNDELNTEKLALTYDMDVVRSFARKLGYVQDKEKLIKISGLSQRETRVFDPGKVLKHGEINYVSEKICKISGFVIFALFYSVFVLYDLAAGNIQVKKSKKVYKSAAGSTVYEIF